MGIGIKLNALGMAMALVFSKLIVAYEFPVFIAGAILCAIGLFILFFSKE